LPGKKVSPIKAGQVKDVGKKEENNNGAVVPSRQRRQQQTNRLACSSLAWSFCGVVFAGLTVLFRDGPARHLCPLVVVENLSIGCGLRQPEIVSTLKSKMLGIVRHILYATEHASVCVSPLISAFPVQVLVRNHFNVANHVTIVLLFPRQGFLFGFNRMIFSAIRIRV